jgi:hypothetical protein
VGAGDALLAGFLAADGPAADALRQAVEWAAQSVATPGNGVSALGQAPAPTGVLSNDIDPDWRLDDRVIEENGGRLDDRPPAEAGEPAGDAGPGARLLVGEVAASLDGLVQSREE